MSNKTARKTVHKIHAPHLGHDVVLGGARPVHLDPTRKHVHFSQHIVDDALTPPTTTSFRTLADRGLRKMYLNDALGDCVIAARGHRLAVLTGNATGTPVIETDAQIKKEYHDIGGYNGTPATDNGCDMIVAADYGVKTGYVDGSKDLGYIIVDATNEAQVKLAMWLFEDLDIAIALPDAWISPFPSVDGFVWDVSKKGSNPNNGHCIAGIDLATNGIMIDTWALEGVITFAALAAYAVDAQGGVIIVHLNADMLAKAQTKAPNGVDWAAIVAAFDADGGNVPAPNPSPSPSPAPSSAVTLADAQKWAVEGLSHLPGTVSTHQAEAAVKASLAAHWPKA